MVGEPPWGTSSHHHALAISVCSSHAHQQHVAKISALPHCDGPTSPRPGLYVHKQRRPPVHPAPFRWRCTGCTCSSISTWRPHTDPRACTCCNTHTYQARHPGPDQARPLSEVGNILAAHCRPATVPTRAAHVGTVGAATAPGLVCSSCLQLLGPCTATTTRRCPFAANALHLGCNRQPHTHACSHGCVHHAFTPAHCSCSCKTQRVQNSLGATPRPRALCFTEPHKGSGYTKALTEPSKPRTCSTGSPATPSRPSSCKPPPPPGAIHATPSSCPPMPRARTAAPVPLHTSCPVHTTLLCCCRSSATAPQRCCCCCCCCWCSAAAGAKGDHAAVRVGLAAAAAAGALQGRDTKGEGGRRGEEGHSTDGCG
jgi:hypothetical protein